MTASFFCGKISEVPIYVYKCARCGEEFEELQKVDEPAPRGPSSGCMDQPCPLQKQMTTPGHRFKNELSSDGIGGYQRQGDTMIRQVTGKNSTHYGSDRSGRS